jgi:hypothetical protein
MVLFDDFTPTQVFYKDAPLNPTQTFFRARTYFTDVDTSMSSITQTGFPPGLSLNFVSNEQRAYLTGTPTATGTYNATLIASNQNSLVGSNPITFVVNDDSVTFQPPTATSSPTFIVSRPLDLFKAGYYTSNIQFKAVSASGRDVTYSTSGLENTGIQTNVSGGILTLTGIPSSPVDTIQLFVTATASNTLATNTASIFYSVAEDTITFNSIPLAARQFVQNRDINPIQISANTLSDRLITNFTGLNFPNSLTISPTGLISGRMDVGSNGIFNIVASTGYVSATQDLSYTVIPDSILLTAPFTTLELVEGQSVPPTQIQGISYSGRTVSNYQVSSPIDTYGLNIGNATGILGGVITPGVVDMTPVVVTANAGAIDSSLNFVFRVLTGPRRVFLSNVSGGGNGPVFTSPSVSDYLFYQYLPITPIQLSASGSGQVYYFVETADLPRGITFDPITSIISGTPVVLGDNSITVYARDDNGTTQLTIRTTTIVPRIVKHQTSAGAYTSLVRQYTEVNAAQGGRDNRVLPNPRLGEFMAPVPSVVTTAEFSTTKCAPCVTLPCPDLEVDAGFSSDPVCEIIDANAGPIFDAGNSSANVCD